MKKFNIYLSLQYNEPKEDSNYIVLVKSDNNFNDFGTQGYFDIYIKSKNKKLLCLTESFKIIFEDNFSKLLTNELQSSNKITSQFIGQVQNEKYYREILYYFDDEIANVITILFSIHDAAIIREKEVSDYDSLINSNEFNEVLLRNSGAYYAYSKGVYILYSDEEQLEVSNVFSSKIKLKIESDLTSYKIKLDYTKNKYLPSNLNIFVGPNSSGKSYTIKKIINILFGKDTIYSEQFDGEVPTFNRIVLFSNTINDNYLATKKDVQNKLNMKSEYHYINLIKQKKFDLQFGVRANFTTSHALHDILFRDWHESSFFTKWKTVIESLKDIINYTTIMIPIIGEDYRELSIPTSEQRMLNYLNKIDKKRDLQFYHNDKPLELSSGQHTFVRFIFYALSLIEQNSLIIIDEPENFMHPNYEIEFIKIISKLLKTTKSIGLIATHSSVFVREVPSKHVHRFVRDNDGIFVGTPEIETFANNLHKISSYIFGDLNKNKEYEKVLKKIIKTHDDPLKLINTLSDNLDTDLLNTLINKYLLKS